jgi:hypothetical protein
LFLQVGLDCGPSILHFLLSLGCKVHATTPSFFPLKQGFSIFLLQLTYSAILPISAPQVARITSVSHMCPAYCLLSNVSFILSPWMWRLIQICLKTICKYNFFVCLYVHIHECFS